MTPPLQPLHHVSDLGSLSRAGFLLCHTCYGKRPFFLVRQKDRYIQLPLTACMGTYSSPVWLCWSICRSFTHIATSLIPLKVAAMPLSTKDTLMCNIWYNVGPQFIWPHMKHWRHVTRWDSNPWLRIRYCRFLHHCSNHCAAGMSSKWL